MIGKIAMIGEGDGVLVFKAAGVSAFTAHDEKGARDLMRTLAKEYDVVFITEGLARMLGDWLSRFDEAPYPVVLTIPAGEEDEGAGMERLKSAMERALGVDILFNRD